MNAGKYTFTKLGGERAGEAEREYLAGLTDVTDDYYEGHLAEADIYSISADGADGVEIGVFGVYEGSRAVMFRLREPYRRLSRDVFNAAAGYFSLRGALAATCDAQLLTACLDRQTSTRVAAYFFRMGSATVRAAEYGRECLRKAVSADLADIHDTRNGAENVAAGRYYVLRQNGVFLGQGFFNVMEAEPGKASIGMEVHPAHRRKNVGRSIILHLADVAAERGLTPVCGCDAENFASRLTLESAGFIAATSYIEFNFGG